MNTLTKGFIIIKDNGQVEKVVKSFSFNERYKEYNKESSGRGIMHMDKAVKFNDKNINQLNAAALMGIDYSRIKCKDFAMQDLLRKIDYLNSFWDEDFSKEEAWQKTTYVTVLFGFSTKYRPNLIARYITGIDFITGDIIILPKQEIVKYESLQPLELFNEIILDCIHEYLNEMSYSPYFTNRVKDYLYNEQSEQEIVNKYYSINWLINLFCSTQKSKLAKEKELLPVNQDDIYTSFEISYDQASTFRSINDSAGELLFMIYKNNEDGKTATPEDKISKKSTFNNPYNNASVKIYNKDIPKIFVAVFRIVAEYFIYLRETITDYTANTGKLHYDAIDEFLRMQYYHEKLFNLANTIITRWNKVSNNFKNQKNNSYFYDDMINEFIIGAAKQTKIYKKEITEYINNLYFN